jgi:formate dehydrogenase major subunit
MVQITIDGQAHAAAENGTILSALRAAGIEVPTLCHDPRLKPLGGCRLCLVQIRGLVNPVLACNTAVADGMTIETHTAEIEEQRRATLQLLAKHYPASAVEQFPDKEFHRHLRAYGVRAAADGSGTTGAFRDHSHPYIRVDMSRCITCQRCIRICDEVQGQNVWALRCGGEGPAVRLRTGAMLLEGGCVSCGACVDTCPTGALEDKTLLTLGVPTQWQRTTCPHCGTGCAMEVGTRNGRITAVRPVLDAPVNKGHLCVKGRYAFGFIHAPDRAGEPMIREKGVWKTVSWQEAIAIAAAGLQRIVADHGPDSVGVLGSSRATNEENYLVQKFARVVLGTNNVDSCARVCHTPSAAAMKMMLGSGAATNSFDDIEQARTILLCGANATENHPALGARIKQAVRRGTQLIVIDPRRIELAALTDFHLPVQPGTNVPLLNAMACSIVEERLWDEEFVRDRVSEWAEFCAFIKPWTPEWAAGICGVEAEQIRAAARLYATSKPSLCAHGLGMTGHTQGTEGVMCLVNLALLTGNLGKPGTGINPLRGQNNVFGVAQMGCDPGTLTGSVPLKEGRALVESVWQAPLPTRPGLNQLRMMDAAESGKLKGLWAIGYDLFLSNANATATQRALESLELVIVQDLFLNETARRFGTVFFPAASPFEKDGTYMNAERRVQRIHKVIEPFRQSKTDREIVCELAAAMGKGPHFQFESAEAVWDEIRAVWPQGNGITYARMGTTGVQWPCASPGQAGASILHAGTFSTGKPAALRRITFNATTEAVSAEYPFLLTTGRSLYQFGAGTLTMRTPNAVLRPADLLDISPADAERLKLREGDRVTVRSRHGSAKLGVQINANLKRGELFATFQTAKALLNYVTSPHRDRFVQTPEYKVTAVGLEVCGGESEPEGTK